MLEELPNIRLVSDNIKSDPPFTYRETKWQYGDHNVQVNIDEYGYHGKAGEQVRINMDRRDFVLWILDLFGID